MLYNWIKILVNIINLKINIDFTNIIPKNLNRLTKLILHDFNQELNPHVLPETLKYFEI